MIRHLATAATVAATLILGGGCAAFREEPPTDELRRLRAENKALREQNEAFAARLGLPATVVVPATRPVAPPGDVAVGMSLDAVRAIAERDGLQLERAGAAGVGPGGEAAGPGVPAGPGEAGSATGETWWLTKVVDVFVPPSGTIERRFNPGADRGKVKEKVEWTKLVRLIDGRVVRIDPVGG